jgi:methyl-accepting chemotaxis protein
MNLAQSLMDKLTYPKKMMLIAIIFLIPIVITTGLIIKQTSEIIVSTRIEQQGLNYIGKVLQLYKNMPQHRGMTNGYLNGKTEFKPKILAKREEISADIAAIDALDAELGEAFRTTALWNEIKQEWATLSSQAFLLAPQDVFQQHTTLILKVADLFEQISHYSGLALDPELDAARIVNTLVTKLPVVTERLGRARGLGSGIAASGMITTNGTVKLESLLTEIKINSSAVVKNLNAVMQDNELVASALTETLAERASAMDTFINAVNTDILNRQIIRIDSSEFFSLGTQAIKTNFQLYEQLLPLLNELFEQRIADARSHRNTIVMVIVAAIAIAIFLFTGFFRSVISNIKQLSTATVTISGGDLTVNLKNTTADETAEIINALNTMVKALNQTITKIGSTSSMLSSSAEQLSTTTYTVNHNISEQQAQTEQIATAMNEMTATVQDIAQNAELLAAEVTQARDETKSGSAIINQTISGINTLAEGVGNASQAVAQLEASSLEIGSILNVIKSVAEQTNLLALNAAIEAARAGEHGRGFAVVADEVRTLANRTQDSAEQIQDMVNTLQDNTRRATSVMNAERVKAEEMSVNTQAATESLSHIVDSMTRISDMSLQVATSAEEQGSVSEEINRNVATVSELSSNNMTATSEVSSASQALANLAEELDQIVKHFKV